MNTSRVMSSLSGRSHMILYAVRDTMYIYLSMITFKASRLPRTTSRIKDASLACPILICPFIKFIQGALFKNNSEHAPSDSKKQNATFLSARAAVLCRGFVQRVRAEVLCRGSVQRFCAEVPCRGSVQRHTLSRRKTCIATAGYRKSSGTMQRHTIFRKIPCIADRKLPFCHDSVQRHTISRGKTCIATAGYRKSSGTMQRHTFFR